MRTETEIQELIEELRLVANEDRPSQSRTTARNLLHTLAWVMNKGADRPTALLGEWIDFTPERMDELVMLVAAEIKRKAKEK